MSDLEYLKKYYKGNIDDAIKRYENGEPVQYIVGDVDFYGNVIKVDKRVLIPRFETEGLCEIALNYLTNTNLDVIDLGTGSGCIPITLKKKLPNINMDAVDISLDALELAKENARLNNVEINFIHGDMVKPLDKKYDCIISNPPYLAHNAEVMDIVKNNEPNIALYAENNGYYFYEEILKNYKNHLKDKYYIFFEIGYNQGEKVSELALKYLDCNVEVRKDLQGYDRYVIIESK
ncbi:MAG: peptide chain release factor N(5)-glutamine methyltransferase [Firmicutes bacterium]|nr:peptide chain release factor N(5)-glutamine methyltransferase [Bacillota bacterium]